MRLSEAQRRVLALLSEVTGDRYRLVTGHAKAACRRLADNGLAEYGGGDGYLGAFYRITPAALAALKGGGDG